GWDAFTSVLAGIATGIGAAVPFLLTLGVPALVAVLWLLRRRKRKPATQSGFPLTLGNDWRNGSGEGESRSSSRSARSAEVRSRRPRRRKRKPAAQSGVPLALGNDWRSGSREGASRSSSRSARSAEVRP